MKSGTRVKSIHFPIDGVGIFAKKHGVVLQILSEHHGDYDIDWVVELKDGIEIARYNTRFIETIVWEVEK